MRFLRSALLLLLTLTVPVSGFASVTMAHCKDMQQSSQAAPQHDMMMGDMAGMEHQQMHHAGMQDDAKATKASNHCKCGCPCKGQCSAGCTAAVALLPKSFRLSQWYGTKEVGEVASPHALAAHHLDLLRPPITAAT